VEDVYEGIVRRGQSLSLSDQGPPRARSRQWGVRRNGQKRKAAKIDGPKHVAGFDRQCGGLVI